MSVLFATEQVNLLRIHRTWVETRTTEPLWLDFRLKFEYKKYFSRPGCSFIDTFYHHSVNKTSKKKNSKDKRRQMFELAQCEAIICRAFAKGLCMWLCHDCSRRENNWSRFQFRMKGGGPEIIILWAISKWNAFCVDFGCKRGASVREIRSNCKRRISWKLTHTLT